jgi:CHAD domain-containing protein
VATNIEVERKFDVRESALTQYLRAQLEALRGGEPGMRAADPVTVHDSRVAIRRLRSTARTFRPLLDGSRADQLRPELQWFGELLGAVRDAQVMEQRLTAALAAESPDLVVGPVASRIRSELAAEIARDTDQLIHALASNRYVAMLQSVSQLADSVHPYRPRRARRLVRKALRRADVRLDVACRAGPADRDPLLHEARKAVKRARYAVEVLRPVEGRPARRLDRRLQGLQDLLGANQDAVVTRQWLRAAGMRAHLAEENAFTYGLLIARQDSAAANRLGGLWKAARQARDRKARGWLNH